MFTFFNGVLVGALVGAALLALGLKLETRVRKALRQREYDTNRRVIASLREQGWTVEPTGWDSL